MSDNELNEIINGTEEEEIEEEYITLNRFPEYEINKHFPNQIRKKSNNLIIAERVDKTKGGYVVCKLNGKTYYKHRILAEQFIENPNNLPNIDHRDRNRENNHLENLRFVSVSDNGKNKIKSTSNTNIVYEYFDKIDNEAIEVNEYGNHQFEFYYYVEKEDSFYFYNGVQYRKLHININKSSGSAYVCMIDTNNKKPHVFLNKFKELYNIEF